MPYIERALREKLHRGQNLTKPGELNYMMSQLIKNYIAKNGESYTTFNSIIGVLSCLSMEVYRRLTAPYEDKKLIQNGEVF